MQCTKDLHSWQLEQGQELNTMREKLDAAQDIRVTNRLLSEGTSMDVKTLDGHLGVTESKVDFVTDCQTEDHCLWENMFNGHQLTTEEKITTFKDHLDAQV